MNGATRCTRLLGCSYLHPHVIPDPHVNSITLGKDDEFVVIANATFWSYVTPAETVAEIRDVISPVAAAKRLQDLAQVKLILGQVMWLSQSWYQPLAPVVQPLWVSRHPKNSWHLTRHNFDLPSDL